MTTNATHPEQQKQRNQQQSKEPKESQEALSGRTLAHLPAVTRPIPYLSLTDSGQLMTLATGQWRIPANPRAWEVVEAERWRTWGAASTGARKTFVTWQKLAFFGLLALFAGLVYAHPHEMLISLLAIITALYLATGVYKAWLLLRGESSGAIATPVLRPRPADEMPFYTVLVPAYHEGAMIPRLVERLTALDYPTNRLEILILIEPDDTETSNALQQCHLPPHMRSLHVPNIQPHTKPRSLNIGLARARGEYLVVFDAEDEPDSDQLLKAVAAFEALPRKVVCVQARVGFYNPRQSILTRFYVVDYASWFGLLLPGLARARGFVPLGGNSNHFRTEALRRLGGWDPFNVTEDADLGARIARAGLQTAMLDSETREEAVSTVVPWIRQRSRWVKGYLQTYLVHMRHPFRLWREMGTRAFINFQLLVGASSLVLLINPLIWALTLAYLLGHGTPLEPLIQSLFPPAISYAGLICFLANFVFLYTNIYICVRQHHYDLVRYALLSPAYWFIMSIAAWIGLVDLIRHPYHWSKTTHGSVIAAGSGLKYLSYDNGTGSAPVHVHVYDTVADNDNEITSTQQRTSTQEEQAPPIKSVSRRSIRWEPLFETGALLVVCMFVIFLHASLPGGGEASVYVHALQAISQGKSVSATIFDREPPTFILSIYPLFLLFGQTLFALRMAMLTYSLLGVLAMFSAGRAIGGRWAGIIPALLLALDPFYVRAANIVGPQAPALAFDVICLSLAIEVMLVTSGWRKLLAMASGAAFALAVLAEPSALVVGVPVLFYMCAPAFTVWLAPSGLLFKRRSAILKIGIREVARDVSCFALGAVLVGFLIALPFMLTSGFQPMFMRLSRVLTFSFAPALLFQTFASIWEAGEYWVAGLALFVGIVALVLRTRAIVPPLVGALASLALVFVVPTAQQFTSLLAPLFVLIAGLALPIAMQGLNKKEQRAQFWEILLRSDQDVALVTDNSRRNGRQILAIALLIGLLCATLVCAEGNLLNAFAVPVGQELAHLLPHQAHVIRGTTVLAISSPLA